MRSTVVNGDRPERRHRPRLRLAYRVRLFRAGNGTWIETTTEDISCEGFFCVTDFPFSPREQLDCELVIAGEKESTQVEGSIVLRCRAEVVRVVRQRDSYFGVACRVGSYIIERQAFKHEFAPYGAPSST